MNTKILTKREYEVFSLLINNCTTRNIANMLGISEKTVRNHISNVIQKLGIIEDMMEENGIDSLKELKLWLQKD